MGFRGVVVAAVVVLLAYHSLSAAPVAQADESANVAEAAVDPPKVQEEVAAVPTGSTTDTTTQDREKMSMSRTGQKFEFQAEVSRLMDIIINSLYSNKDIFLRELISNASDALDKIRFLALTNKNILGQGDTSKLEIQIKLDPDKKILSIRDRGIGMTREDLIKNLGTIAKSGTSAFLEQVQKGGDLNLIGQFGVGFYSVYLVADYVEVHSKHNDDKQWVWASRADGNFEVYEDTESEDLGRGTEIIIHLKDEAAEYSQEDKLRELVKKYSEFINFPISLWTSKEVDVPVDEEEEDVEDVEDVDAKETEEEETSEEEEDSGDDEDDEDEPEGKEVKKPKTTKETQWDWEVLNDVKAIWLRNPKDVTEEEYNKFYKSFSKDFNPDPPLGYSHFTAEGDVEFKAILYIPPRAPQDYYDNYYSTKANLKLYVRRVFISDDFDDLLPKYLNFLKGIVDSDTLPLNVSREMLQQHSSLKTIKKKLVRKALDMIRRLAEDEAETDEADAEDQKDAKSDEKKGKYLKFWNEYGKALKLGVIEDSGNRQRLTKLLRFHSSKSGDKLISLDDYIGRMKEGQKQIYYLTGQTKEQLERSPFLEKLLKKGYEVLYLTDAVDEYLMQNLTEYEEKKFQNASKEDLKIAGKDKDKEKQVADKFKDLTKWWKDTLDVTDVDGVKVSSRLSNTPCIVVTSKYGWSANMERIMQAQALTDSSKQSYMKGRKTLEINPNHPLITQLREMVAADAKDTKAAGIAKILYETALLESGFILEDPSNFAKRVYSTLGTTLNIDADAKVVDEEDEVQIGDEIPKEGGEVEDEDDPNAPVYPIEIVDEDELDDEEDDETTGSTGAETGTGETTADAAPASSSEATTTSEASEPATEGKDEL